MDEKTALDLEELKLRYPNDKAGKWAYRSRVPGGWLIFIADDCTLTSVAFNPDPNHAWEGGTHEHRRT